MIYKADLHIHSCFSDGKHHPYAVIALAVKGNISCISITDHDSISGAITARDFNGYKGLEIIPGIELSADYNGKEVHILGYHIDLDNKAISEHSDSIKNLRINRIGLMIDKLEELSMKIDKDEFFGKYSDTNSIGRPHLAQELVKHGFVNDFKTAFTKYLGDYKPAYVKKLNPDYKIILNLIKSAGGVAIIAHPGKFIKHNVLQDFIGSGINGFEVIHPSHKQKDSKYFSGVCQSYNLLTSGGSDFH